MPLNVDNLIRLPVEDSRSNYLDGFWAWVEFLAADDYQGAIQSIQWPGDPYVTPDQLKECVTGAVGDEWSVVIPNQRLVNKISDAMEYHVGWFLAHIPLTNCPEDPKDDDIPIFGQAVSFFVREHDGSYVMEIEIFHL